MSLVVPFLARGGARGCGFHFREEAAQRDEYAVDDGIQNQAVEEREEVVDVAELVSVGVHDDVVAGDGCFALGGVLDDDASGEVFALVEEQCLKRRVVDRVARDVRERADDGPDYEQEGTEHGPPLAWEEQYEEDPEENP